MSQVATLSAWDILRNSKGEFSRDHVLSVGMMIIRKSHSHGEIDSVVQLCSDLQFYASRRKREIGRRGGTGYERGYAGG